MSPKKYNYSYSDKILRKDISIQVEDTVTLKGWFFNCPDFNKSLIYFYGVGHTLQNQFHRLSWMSERFKINILCLDYREYGNSNGAASARKLPNDGLKIYDYAIDSLHFNQNDLFVYGMSIGAIPALHVVTNRKVSGLILEGAPTSIQDYIQVAENRELSWYLKPFVNLRADSAIENYHPQPIESIPNYYQPLLIIISGKDDVTPLQFSMKLYNSSASINKMLCICPDGTHAALNISKKPAVDSLNKFFNLKDIK
jgi:dipeptidyl aminopeptidase/acylaminoacyl peptidase